MKIRIAKKIISVTVLRLYPEGERYRRAVKRVNRYVGGRLWVISAGGQIFVNSLDNTTHSRL